MNRAVGDRFQVKLPDGREVEYDLLAIEKAI